MQLLYQIGTVHIPIVQNVALQRAPILVAQFEYVMSMKVSITHELIPPSLF
jgi:hypothetical protein